MVLVFVCEMCLVIGQLLLKRGMQATPVRILFLAGGVAMLSGWFLLWLRLLAQWDLSRLFPFEGLNSVLVVLGAGLFLKERVPLRGWMGIALISVGVALVSGS
jgi:uncharacterized membrane protein